MANYSYKINGDLEGYNNSILKNFSIPSYSSSIDGNSYLNREGLFAIISGSLYIKRSGSSPTKLLDDSEYSILQNSLSNVSNLRLSGSQLLLDITPNSGSTRTISGSLSILSTDTYISSFVMNDSNYQLTITQNNNSSFTVNISGSILNYLNSRTSTDLNFSNSGSFLSNRTTLLNWFQSNILSSSLAIGSQPSGSQLLVNHEQVKSCVDIKVATPNTGVSMPSKTVSGSYTVTKNDWTIRVNASGSSVNIQLPDASIVIGSVFNIKKIDLTTNSVNILASGSQTIDGLTSQSTNSLYNNFQIQSNGIGYDTL